MCKLENGSHSYQAYSTGYHFAVMEIMLQTKSGLETKAILKLYD